MLESSQPYKSNSDETAKSFRCNSLEDTKEQEVQLFFVNIIRILIASAFCPR